MKKLLFALLFAMVLVLGACGGGGDEGTSEDTSEEPATEEKADEGTEDATGDDSGEGTEGGGEGTVDTAAAEKAYQNNCSSCHGGELGGGFGPALAQIGSKYSADEIVNIIKNGQGSMPAQEQVSDEDAQLIAGWLATMK
ncbi:cytochrome c551 [Halobacillus yeomjeoni]|uniref:Cytochrome c n=1 Tax=Halobacillus yeomjeoni TaxID=311194 RepID=A0A931HWI1_9BACI|nr:cytochrome c [Halobacillus yeomjeoni]MBH0230899.1 cytochrome c [Halobacillus yeomjeoni]